MVTRTNNATQHISRFRSKSADSHINCKKNLDLGFNTESDETKSGDSPQITNHPNKQMTEQYCHIQEKIENSIKGFPSDITNTTIDNIGNIDNKISHIKRLQLAHSDTRNMIPHQISMIWCLGGRLNNKFPIKYQKALVTQLELMKENPQYQSKLSLLLDHSTYLKNPNFFNKICEKFGDIFEIKFIEDELAEDSPIAKFVENAQATNPKIGIKGKNIHRDHLYQALGGNPAILSDFGRMFEPITADPNVKRTFYIDFDDLENSLSSKNIEKFHELLHTLFIQNNSKQTAISTIGGNNNNNRLFFNHHKKEELKEQLENYIRHLNYYTGPGDRDDPNNPDNSLVLEQPTYNAFPQKNNLSIQQDYNIILSGPGFFNMGLEKAEVISSSIDSASAQEWTTTFNKIDIYKILLQNAVIGGDHLNRVMQTILSWQQHNKQVSGVKRKTPDGKNLFNDIELKPKHRQQLIDDLKSIINSGKSKSPRLNIKINNILSIVTSDKINYDELDHAFNKLLNCFSVKK